MKKGIGFGVGVLILLGGPPVWAAAIILWMILAVIRVLLGVIR